MNIILYKNQSPPNKIEKSLTGEHTFENVRFIEKESLSVTAPRVVLNYTTEISDIMAFNYCFIPKLNRYYYIDNISTDGGLIILNCRCDVLMSFKSDIFGTGQNSQYIIRNETHRRPYLYDDKLPIRSDHRYDSIPFGSDVFNKSCARVILETTGKGGNIDE